MMAGMAAGQALVSALLGGGADMKGAGAMGGSSILSGLLANPGGRPEQGAMGMHRQKIQAGNPGSPGLARQQQAVPLQAGAFELVSKLPGRRRYRATGLTPELAQLLQEKLQQLAFLQEVQVNAATGSLLFLLVQNEQSEGQMDKLAAFLREHIFRPAPHLSREPVLSLESHAGLLTRSIRGTVRDFSGWIKSHTGGLLDVSSMASIFLLCKGLQKMLASQQLPSGSQMFWWAVSLMRGWQTV